MGGPVHSFLGGWPIDCGHSCGNQARVLAPFGGLGVATRWRAGGREWLIVSTAAPSRLGLH